PPPATPAAPEPRDAAAPVPARAALWRGRLRVAGVFAETPDVKTFRLVPAGGGPVPFAFAPGQFLTVTVEEGGRRVGRSYTIASPPTRSAYVELTVKREAQGAVSRHLHDRVGPGDELEVAGPAGAFTFGGEDPGGIVLIAGGVGITPMMSIVRTLTDLCWPGEIHLIYGARSTRDFVFRDELEHLQRRHANLQVVATMRRAEGTAWMGPEGVVTRELIERSVPGIARRRVHLCGPPPMMEAVRAALAELGVPAGAVRTEAFGPARGQEATPPVPKDAPAGGPEAAAAPVPTVSFARSGRSAPLPPGRTVLEAAEAAGVAIDFSCRVGVCGTCAVPLRSGAVTMEVEDGLAPEDKARGLVLACQAKSAGDLVVEA
ncbi:MAG: 2Fe-2S iron-sulfur cluster binding domain-containing protein, partial [Acetobacteraceae bacterium]|nr:2Fe-2S iron-sulfur cluster binding domain-containing protein [Acetobacteraceae bacterium]